MSNFTRHHDSSLLGRESEEAACRYLGDRGYTILVRNWRKPWGELDIVAEKGGVFHFVEVKGQSVHSDAFAAHVRAGSRKLERVIRTARTWLAERGYTDEPSWQVDIVQVTVDYAGRRAHIIHFLNVTE